MESVKSKILKGTVYNIFGTILMLAIGIGASVVFVRYLGDRDFGISVYISNLSLMTVTLCSLGLGTYQSTLLPKFKAENRMAEFRYIIVHNIQLRLALLFLVVVAIIITKWSGNLFFIKADDQFYHFLYGFSFLQMLLAVIRGPLQVEYQQKLLNSCDVAFLSARLFLVLPVIYFDLGLTGFLWTEIAVEVGQLALLSVKFKQIVWNKLKNVVAKRYTGDILKTSVPMFVVDFSSQFFGKEMDIILLGFLADTKTFTDITIYSLSYLLVLRSFSFLGLGTSSSATLLMNSSSELISTGKGQLLEKLIEKQFRLLALMIMPITAGGMLLGETILSLLYGSIFVGSGFVIRIIFLGIGITSISYITRPILFVLGKEKSLVKQRCFIAIIKVVLFAIFVPSFGLTGLVIVSIFSIVLLSCFEMKLISEVIKIVVPWKFIFKSLSGSILMALLVFIIKHYMGDVTAMKLIVLVSFGVLTYLLSMFILKPFSQDDCQSFDGIKIFGVFDAKRLLSIFTTSLQ